MGGGGCPSRVIFDRDESGYRARNLVERFFNRIKHCRRVATRYDKLAANYLAFVQLASIRLWLRVNESTS
jgi:transposase